MTGLHTIYRDQGDQELVHVPPFAVASASYVIEDLSVSETDPTRIIASGSATVDDLDETTTAAAGPRAALPRRVGITGTAAERGRTYWITSADGTQEPVVVEAVAANSITVAGRLSATYAIGSTLTGAEIRCTFPSAAAAREDLQEETRVLRVLWTYSIDSRTVRVPEQIRVVRNAPELEAWLVPAETRLKQDWPELCQILGGGAEGVRNLVRSCAKATIADLRTMYQDPASILMGEQGFELLIRRCVYRFGELGHIPEGRDDKQTWVAQQRVQWRDLFKAMANGGGHSTAEIEPADDVATGTKRPRKRYLTRPA